MEITFRKLEDTDNDYKKLHKWCSNKNVYEWFEQRVLTFDEIKKKYKKKLFESNQDLYIIECDNNDIGLIQIYEYEKDIDNDEINKMNNLYEFDIYIGEENYLSKGIGSIVINKVVDKIYKEYNAEAIILRPFKRNVRAIKCYEKCNFKTIFEYYGKNTLDEEEIIVVLLNNKNANK